MRRIERLINLIAALLETSRPLTAEEIRRTIAGYDQSDLDNFRRTFERDKKDLRDLGIPLETVDVSVWGDEPEGYRIPKDKYYLPELELTEDEVAALSLAAGSVLGTRDQATAGLRKLAMDAAMSWSAPKILLGADVAAEQPHLDPLFTAALERTPVAFDYETSDGAVGRRELEPYTLAHRRGHWYAVGRDRNRDAIRSFKVSRITSKIAPLEGTYEVPADFDVEKHAGIEPWELPRGAPEVARVRFDEDMRWWVEQNLPDATTEDADGGVTVEVPYSHVAALVSWVFAFGDRAEILAPAEARDAVLAQLRPHLDGEGA